MPTIVTKPGSPVRPATSAPQSPTPLRSTVAAPVRPDAASTKGDPRQAPSALQRRDSALLHEALKRAAPHAAPSVARLPTLPADLSGLAQASAQQAADRIDLKSPAAHAAGGTQPSTAPIGPNDVEVSHWDAGIDVPQTHDLGGYAMTVCRAQGARETMEDTSAVRWFADSRVGVAAVFDGHGGTWVAEYAARIVPELIEAHLRRLTPKQRASADAVCVAIADAFAPQDGLPVEHGSRSRGSPSTIADAMAAQGLALGNPGGGATAVVAVFVDKALYVANLGDSRAVLAHADGSAQRLSTDHRIQGSAGRDGVFEAHDAETQRVLDHGGTLFVRRTTPRLEGGRHSINMTRALGDLGYAGLGRRADVNAVPTGTGDVLMLGCDGMFSRLHDDAHAAYIATQRQAGRGLVDIGEDLVKASYSRRSQDNMTTVLIDLG